MIWKDGQYVHFKNKGQDAKHCIGLATLYVEWKKNKDMFLFASLFLSGICKDP